MRQHLETRHAHRTGPAPSDTNALLYLLNCYDVWSATPDRLCLARAEHAAPQPTAQV